MYDNKMIKLDLKSQFRVVFRYMNELYLIGTVKTLCKAGHKKQSSVSNFCLQPVAKYGPKVASLFWFL